MELGFTYYRASDSKVINAINSLKFKRKVLRIVAKHGIQGFTLLKALGAWQGKVEPSYQMSLIGVPKRTVKALARDLRDEFRQDSVLVKDGAKVEFI